VYAHWRWRRRGGLIGILGGTTILRACGLARENNTQAAGEEILIRDRVVVVVTGSETSRPVSALLVLKWSVADVECKWPDGNH
jgi:hypothetical protein